MKFFNGSVEFVDVKRFPLSEPILELFIKFFGSSLINIKSKTWRELDSTQKELDPIILIKNFPTVMKRPIIVIGDKMFLGWSESTIQQINRLRD